MVADFVSLVVAVVLGLVALAVVFAGLDVLFRLAVRLFSIPGVVVHEFAHRQVCDLVGVRVLEVVYFRFGDPPGYVRHARPDRYRASFAISVAPFLVNTVVSLAAFLALAALVMTGELAGAIAAGSVGASASALIDAFRVASSETLAVAAVLAWLGLSVGMHAFPSTGDANTLWDRSRAEWRRSPVVLLGLPVVAVIYFVNVLSRLYADLLYALGLGVLAFGAFVTLGTVGY